MHVIFKGSTWYLVPPKYPEFTSERLQTWCSGLENPGNTLIFSLLREVHDFDFHKQLTHPSVGHRKLAGHRAQTEDFLLSWQTSDL